jgi:transmembrane sensor
MTQNNRIWVLMSRRLSGEATPAESDELRQLMEQFPDQQYLFGILHAYFSDPSTFTRSSEDADLEIKFRRIVGSADTSIAPETAAVPEAPVRRLSLRRSLKYAASVAALLFLIWGVYRIVSGLGSYSPVVRAIAHNEEVQAKAGARTRLVLPDGTLVWLNSNSKLRYNREFNSQNREVVLEGEAYFEVTKNAGHPFIVHAATLDIEVLGTSFTVKSYPQDTTVEATLLKGAIEVRRKGSLNTTQVILKPNEKIVFNTLSGLDSTDRHSDPVDGEHHRGVAGMAVDHIRTDLPDSNKVETAWMYNRLVFDGENFQELAAKLERWYDVTIVLKDERLNRYRFSGSFTSESIEEALKDLQLTADFTYKINGKEIELYAKK